MHRKKIAILGSCVSRDPLELRQTCLDIELYIARCSFASMFGKPFSLAVPKYDAGSVWQRRMLENDARKLSREQIKAAQPDAIIIDFIDERFCLLSHNGSAATLSVEMAHAFGGNYDPAQLISRKDDIYRDMWTRGWLEFIALSREMGLLHQCYLNKVYYAKHDTNQQKFNELVAAAENTNLAWCYETAQRLMPELHIIETPTDLLVGDHQHKWGRAPFHYTSAAQTFFLDELEANLCVAHASR